MKNLNELICSTDPAWPIVEQWILNANRSIKVLPVNKVQAEKVLVELQVTTRSPMGAIVYETGGILFDNGWLRLLGSGYDSLKRNLSSWNKLDQNGKFTRLEGAMLIADDVLGGFFAMNGGAFGGKVGDVYYLAPETLVWENINMSYSNFLHWALTGDMQKFYEIFRWQGWEKEVEKVSGDQGFLFYPFLWTEKEGVESRSRSIVPIEELWEMSCGC